MNYITKLAQASLKPFDSLIDSESDGSYNVTNIKQMTGNTNNIGRQVKDLTKGVTGLDKVRGLLKDKKWDSRIKKASDTETVALEILGDKVQGVGLRKKLHGLLDRDGLEGLAVNNPEEEIVEAILSGTPEQRNKVEKELASLIESETGAPVTINEHSDVPDLQDVHLSKEDLAELDKSLFMRYIQSDKPTDEQLAELGLASNMSHEKIIEDMTPRYRLKGTPDGGLEGRVPELAMRQLRREIAPYHYMLDDKLVRSQLEALQIMHPEDREKYFKTAGHCDKGSSSDLLSILQRTKIDKQQVRAYSNNKTI